MQIIESAMRRSRTVIMSLAVIIVAGVVTYVNVPKEAEPDLNIPIIYVSMTHDGISPEDAERLLIRPMEQEIRTIEGIEELTGNVDKISGISCSFEGVAVDLERADARHLFRIAQEAVNNALRHGKATRIRVRLARSGENRTLTVEDNGIGIPNEVDPGVGMGLRLMGYRASKIGGSFEVERGAEGGTVVRCRF